MDSGGIAPLILNLGTRWRWVVNFTPRQLYFREISRYLLNKRLGCPPSWRKQKNLLPIPGFECHIVQPVAQSLYLLSYHGCRNLYTAQIHGVELHCNEANFWTAYNCRFINDEILVYRLLLAKILDLRLDWRCVLLFSWWHSSSSHFVVIQLMTQ